MSPVASRAQLEALLKRHRSNRTGSLDRDVPFLWRRVLLSLFSYALLLTDVIRTGLGIQNSQAFPALEPSEILNFGPFAHPVQHIEQNMTVVMNARDIWMYKFDSTSTAMRAYAEFFQLEALSPCLFYREPCISAMVTSAAIFRLLDSLVETMASREPRAPARSRLPTSLTLRTTSRWSDRIHDFILPEVFGSPMLRTNQALYYTDALLSSAKFQFCGASRVRPYACTDSWTQFTRLCNSSDSECKDVGHMWGHMAKRKQLLRKQYNGNVSLDILILESHGDHSKPALSFHGRKFLDVVVITRIRNCTLSPSAVPQDGSSQSPPVCTTIAVDDYRYESMSVSSNVTDWYTIIGVLRCIGQGYVWLRMALLFLGCFYARSAEPRYQEARLHARIAAAVRTVFLIPSQVIVYGSVFPIACYVLAHLVDSTMVYELVSQQFITALGVFQLNFHDFVVVSSVSMRTVWVIALVLHAQLFMRTQRNWSPVMNGVPGVPELSITFVSCLTIMGQFRAIEFRDTRIESISEVVSSHRIAAIRANAYDNTHDILGLLVFGNTLDVQCLLAAVVALCLIALALSCGSFCLNRIDHARGGHRRIELVLLPTTFVSYAAGSLWSANALVVSWADMQMSVSGDDKHYHRHHQQQQFLGPRRAVLLRQGAFTSLQRAPKPPRHANRVSPSMLLPSNDTSAFSLAVLDQRSRHIESMVYITNLAALTDPLVLTTCRWDCSYWDTAVAVCESRATGRVFLIPLQAMRKQSHRDNPVDWRDYRVLWAGAAAQLPWLDLLQCG